MPPTFERMTSRPLVLALLWLSGCANHAVPVGQDHAEERLPTSDEVTAYIHSQWESDYGPQFARLASRPSQMPTLQSVNNVSCGYYIATPECSFDVLAHFPDESPQLRNMAEQFGWSRDGTLQSVIVMYHERRP